MIFNFFRKNKKEEQPRKEEELPNDGLGGYRIVERILEEMVKNNDIKFRAESNQKLNLIRFLKKQAQGKQLL